MSALHLHPQPPWEMLPRYFSMVVMIFFPLVFLINYFYLCVKDAYKSLPSSLLLPPLPPSPFSPPPPPLPSLPFPLSLPLSILLSVWGLLPLLPMTLDTRLRPLNSFSPATWAGGLDRSLPHSCILFVLPASSTEQQVLLSSAPQAAANVTLTSLWSSNKSHSNHMYILLVVFLCRLPRPIKSDRDFYLFPLENINLLFSLLSSILCHRN